MAKSGQRRFRTLIHDDRAGNTSRPSPRRQRLRCTTVPRTCVLIEHELALIAELGYEPYFLTVQDIVAFARSQRHPLPGPRIGGQLGRLLRARHHRSRSCAHADAVRALHQQGAQRAARHRRRLRAPAARGGDAVRLRQIRPRSRGARRDAHHLPAEERGARRRPRARPRSRAGRPADRRVRVVGRPRDPSRTHPRSRLRSRQSGHPSASSRCRASCWAFRATCRSTSAASSSRAVSLERMVPVENAAMEIAPSSSGTRTTSMRWACSRSTAWRSACCPRSAARSTWCPQMRGTHAAHAGHSGRGSGGLRDDPARRHDRRVPDRIARAAVDAAAPEAADVLRPRHRSRDRAPGPDPGRHGASLSASAGRDSSPSRIRAMR